MIARLWKGASWRRRIALAALLVALFYTLASWLLSLAFTARRNRPDPSEPRATVSEVWLRGEAMPLSAWVVEPRGSASGIVLLFHGLADSRSAARLDLLADEGFGVLAINFRAHGTSEGSLTSFGHEEREDVRRAHAFASHRWPGQRLAAWGFSMGAAALCLADELRWDAVVLEAAYTNLGQAFQRRLDQRVPRLLHPLAFGPRWISARRLGIRPEEVNPLASIVELDAGSLLIVRGAEDERVLAEDLEAFGRARPDATTLTIPGIGHRDPTQVGPDAARYRRRILRHFEQALR